MVLNLTDDDTLSDDGICRLHASKKNLIIAKILDMQGFERYRMCICR